MLITPPLITPLYCCFLFASAHMVAIQLDTPSTALPMPFSLRLSRHH